ncbi:conserved hypothetical protein [Ricinus communis]|uniref:Uncharacterized protein n=1 Tax=Ricinus communis TaxID=3988 RepID=B9SKP6_RICCO|nr:conserved hypothetical protein [Ricinus communis]
MQKYKQHTQGVISTVLKKYIAKKLKVQLKDVNNQIQEEQTSFDQVFIEMWAFHDLNSRIFQQLQGEERKQEKEEEEEEEEEKAQYKIPLLSKSDPIRA